MQFILDWLLIGALIMWLEAFDIDNNECFLNLKHVESIYYLERTPSSSHSVLTFVMPMGYQARPLQTPTTYFVFDEKIKPILEVLKNDMFVRSPKSRS